MQIRKYSKNTNHVNLILLRSDCGYKIIVNILTQMDIRRKK